MEKIGALVIQHEKRNYFDEIDIIVLRAIASQLAGAIENARLLLEFHRQRKNLPIIKKMEEQIRAGASPPAAIKTIAKQYIDYFFRDPILI